MTNRSYVPPPEGDNEDEDDAPDTPRGLSGLGELHPSRLSNAQTPPRPQPDPQKKPAK